MIISHKHRYIFIQNPRTASSSMGQELCQMYNGEKILRKHDLYSVFLKAASNEERQYYVFTGQRNPLDALVTRYFRTKFDKLENIQANPSSPGWKNNRSSIAKWKYISDNDLSFIQYFNRYHGFMIDWSYRKIERDKMDFVYRYENLQEDFSSILKAIGIEQKRELPQHSKKTKRKDSNFYQYYIPGIQPRVQIGFGKCFEEMGYSFPDGWIKPNLSDRIIFYKGLAFKLPVLVVPRLYAKVVSLLQR